MPQGTGKLCTYLLFVQYTYRIRSIVKLYPGNYIVMHVWEGGNLGKKNMLKKYVHFIIARSSKKAKKVI